MANMRSNLPQKARETNKTATKSNEAGFTLVELSIVLVVIGLIIGGVLKGQEMIQSARLKSTMQQVQAIQAAHVTFKDKYGGMPGDLLDANTLLGASVGAGWGACDGSANNCDGDSVIEGRNTAESLLYWQHLAAGGMITGIVLDDAPVASFGAGLPAAPVGGGLELWNGTINGRFSHWLLLPTRPATNGGPFDGDQLAQLDKKYDDGRPGTGWIRAFTGACMTNNAGNAPTNTSEYVLTAANCRAAFEVE